MVTDMGTAGGKGRSSVVTDCDAGRAEQGQGRGRGGGRIRGNRGQGGPGGRGGQGAEGAGGQRRGAGGNGW